MAPSAELPHACPQMEDAVGDVEVPVRCHPPFREYGIEVLDGGTSKLTIPFCPFCGVELPPSLRDPWFDRLEGLGLEPGDPAIPPAMRTDEWWRGDPSVE